MEPVRVMTAPVGVRLRRPWAGLPAGCPGSGGESTCRC